MTAPPGPARRIDLLEPPLALLTLASVWVGVETLWLPSWLYLGPVTLPTTSLYPVPLAAVTLGVAAVAYRRTGTVRFRRLLLAAIAALVLLGAALAVITLNRATSGGVFFAGLPSLAFGVLLSVVIIVNAAVAAGRRAYRATS